MMIDLHTHTTCSDGTDSPTELMKKACEVGIDVIGLTDHDTVSGWEEASIAARANNIRLVRGMEITATCHGVRVHILGYLFNSEDNKVQDHIRSVRESREGRARAITERLAADFPVTFEDVMRQAAPGATLGRPHIADALVEKGILANRSEAFEQVLATSSPYYVEQYAPDARAVVEFIHAAGGKTVWAHPKAMKRGTVAPDRAYRELAEAGLFGIEVDHRDNPADTRQFLTDIVNAYGLARFGSSDYHGRGKPNKLGENTTSPDAYRALIDGTFAEVI
ncbi:PHP domain-containing protein [Arcanobacterium haemolyticum]|uniref:PHP domain protein n=1 Tax=Arcanobacterium haemolyticum (strain ATCC 9345 / DSM 20595 / CCM 5947 / CCUG 17215 / LMG 16163 / NBRC 15585 / NCTC 8452 / 11018) TaxID=644284 RepID=D7BJW1_ARCHD|nr:PHP domain-containing protein [Arcanobacterium haemolyticum]ADH92941.1 PHP domain protein [Arcanobacterium haemolyticum DSM 20595]QCX47019.1 PHP domain-containing protein [Arcanobacterium haemolyticum]SQH28303.1 Histidinol phosphatase and related hydrolases of the PHP family [Arcanobacterium haemolyticum]